MHETVDRKAEPMSSQRTKRLVAVSAIGVLMAGGAALGSARAVMAPALAPAHNSSYSHDSNRGCDEVWGDGGCDVHIDHGGFDHNGERGVDHGGH
jgi:hypothetical protein